MSITVYTIADETFWQAGHMAVPVVVTDSDSWSGFRPDKILTLK